MYHAQIAGKKSSVLTMLIHRASIAQKAPALTAINVTWWNTVRGKSEHQRIESFQRGWKPWCGHSTSSTARYARFAVIGSIPQEPPLRRKIRWEVFGNTTTRRGTFVNWRDWKNVRVWNAPAISARYRQKRLCLREVKTWIGEASWKRQGRSLYRAASIFVRR